MQSFKKYSPKITPSKSNYKSQRPLHKKSKWAVNFQDSHSYALKISLNQTYQNVLNRLLRLNNLCQFVKQSSRYVIFTQEVVQQFKQKQDKFRKSLKYASELGNILMKDGGFIKHYCHLLEYSGLCNGNQIRKQIYQNFQKNIKIRKGMFYKYFTKQFITEEKKNYKQNNNQNIQKVNFKYQKDLKYQEQQKICKSQNHKKFRTVASVNFEKKSNSNKKKQQLQERKDSNTYTDEEDEIVWGIKTPQKNNETFQEKQRRWQGLSQEKKSNHKSQRKSVVLKFNDHLKNDKRLSNLFQQKLQQQKQRRSRKTIQLQSIKRQELSFSSQRTSLFHSIKNPSLRTLDTNQLSKLSQLEREILQLYPTIRHIVEKDEIQILGEVDNLGTHRIYKVIKGALKDDRHYRQNYYHCLWFELLPIQKQQKGNKELKKDKSVSVYVVQNAK